MSNIDADSPLGKQLQNVVQQKLIELGWSSGGLDDSVLAEYIVLMVAGGKTPQEVAEELSNDFLSDNTGTPDFAQWLFQQVDILAAQSNTQMDSSSSDLPGSELKNDDNAMDVDNSTATAPADGSIPTGPKSMRSRDKRFLGQMNKALDRSNDNKVLHRIKGAAGGVGRINAHGTPKGPAAGVRGVAPKGPRATMNRLANAPSAQQLNPMNQLGLNPNSPLANMTPQQQMQLMAMYEQQAQMMAQIFNPQQQTQGFRAKGANSMQSGKSLFDRVNKGPKRSTFKGAAQSESQADAMTDSSEAHPDHNTTMCRFNLTCTNPSCYFVHQSPAAPPGIAVDMSDTCSFGAACKNHKCTGRHPSPAKQGTQDCKFYPNCTNPTCPFKHPALPACRNGADCTNPGCKFSHVKVECKFDPCLNPTCIYKHREGQKRGAFNDKVWVAGASHVSDRKFVDDPTAEEDLILPEAKAEESQPDGIVT